MKGITKRRFQIQRGFRMRLPRVSEISASVNAGPFASIGFTLEIPEKKEVVRKVEIVTKYSFQFTPVLLIDIENHECCLVNLSYMMIMFIEYGTFRNFIGTKLNPDELRTLLFGKDGNYLLEEGYKSEKLFDPKKMNSFYNHVVDGFTRHKFPTRKNIVKAVDIEISTPDIPFKRYHKTTLSKKSWRKMLSGDMLVAAVQGTPDHKKGGPAGALKVSNHMMHVLDPFSGVQNNQNGTYIRFCGKVAVLADADKNLFRYDRKNRNMTSDNEWKTFAICDSKVDFFIG